MPGSEEWGLIYSMILTEACIRVAVVHDRMSAILPKPQLPFWIENSESSLCVEDGCADCCIGVEPAQLEVLGQK